MSPHPDPVNHDLQLRPAVLEQPAPPVRQRYGAPQPQEVVFVRDRPGLHRVRQDAIRSLHADGNYVELLRDQSRFVLRSSLREVLLQPRDHFVQVNRNTAVNVHHLARVDCDTVTVEGVKHTLSRNFRRTLLERITVLG